MNTFNKSPPWKALNANPKPDIHKPQYSPMAITLNKHAIRCVKIALAKGIITPTSSARTSLYDISRHWRRLTDATSYAGKSGEWSEREEEAAQVIISTLTYLQRIGCIDIEKLLKDTIEQMDSEIE